MNTLSLARKSSWECLTVPLNQPYMRFCTWLRWRQINLIKPNLNIPSSKSMSCPSFPLVTSGSTRKASCYFWQPLETIIVWTQRKKNHRYLQSTVLQKIKKNCRKWAVFNKKYIFIYFALCCIQCPKTLYLIYQKQHSELFSNVSL